MLNDACSDGNIVVYSFIMCDDDGSVEYVDDDDESEDAGDVDDDASSCVLLTPLPLLSLRARLS